MSTEKRLPPKNEPFYFGSSSSSSRDMTPKEGVKPASFKAFDRKRVTSSSVRGYTPTSRKKPVKQSSTSASSTTSKETTPMYSDENKRPISATKSGTPLSHHSRYMRQKTPNRNDVLTPSATPLAHSSKANTYSQQTSRSNRSPLKSSSSGPSKKLQTPTKSGPATKNERSVLFEFRENIIISPRGNINTMDSTPKVTYSSKSKLEISASRNLRLSRSKSAGHLTRGDCGEGGVRRAASDARISETLDTTKGKDDGSEHTRLVVGVRVRPLGQREHGNAVFVKESEVSVASDMGSTLCFRYDHCFTSSGPQEATQEDIFDAMARPLLENAFLGYNACLFAYGQTGSGKTYSMMGPELNEVGVNQESGIIPRFCRELLQRCLANHEEDQSQSITTTVEISYLEVYNEKIHDLLVPGSVPLRVREHPLYGPYVVDLSKHTVNSFKEIQHWLAEGNKKRATAATEMNDKSSRSHSLFSIILTQTFMAAEADGTWSHEQTRRSNINLIDLAGSERISHSSVSSDRLREGVSINRSLMTLGKVMSSLAEKRGFVPYRESVLTWLLKDSLGGNSKTSMLATVSPCSANLDETLATLRYARQARSIVNTVRVNETPQDTIIRQLRAEVNRLKELQLEVERAKINLSSPAIILSPKPTPKTNEQIAKMESELNTLRNNLRDLQAKVEKKEKLIEEKEEELLRLEERGKSIESELECLRDREAGNRSHLEGTVKMIELELASLRETLAGTQDELEERNAKFREAEEILGQVERQKVCVERELGTLQERELENQRRLEESVEHNIILQGELEGTKTLLDERENEVQELRKHLAGIRQGVEDRSNMENAVKVVESELRRLRETLTETQEELLEKQERLSETERILEEVEMHRNNLNEDLEGVRERDKEHLEKLEETIEQNITLEGSLKQLKIILKEKEAEVVDLKRTVKDYERKMNSVQRELDTCRLRLEDLELSRKNLKTEMSASSGNLASWQNQLAKLQDSHQHLITENLKVLGNMEKAQRLHNEEMMKREEVIADNKKLKEDLSAANEKLMKKATIVEKLKTKLKILEELLNTHDFTRKSEQKSPQQEKTDYEIKMYEIVMETAYPFHWEHLMRKARTYGEMYHIPYDFELGEAVVNVKHLILKAKVTWNRIHFGKWIEKLEDKKTWTREMDKEINWVVDFGDYFDYRDTQAKISPGTAIDNVESAINMGTQISKNGCICPRAWRKTLAKRHVLGIKDDTNALTKHFANAGDSCRVNIILNRMTALISRLEVATELMEP